MFGPLLLDAGSGIRVPLVASLRETFEPAGPEWISTPLPWGIGSGIGCGPCVGGCGAGGWGVGRPVPVPVPLPVPGVATGVLGMGEGCVELFAWLAFPQR